VDFFVNKYPKTSDRLNNYKFRSALEEAEGEGVAGEDLTIIEILSRWFGNCGWMGDESDCGILIDRILFSLGIRDQGENR